MELVKRQRGSQRNRQAPEVRGEKGTKLPAYAIYPWPAVHVARSVSILARGHLLSFKKYFFSYFINSRSMIIPVSIWWWRSINYLTRQGADTSKAAFLSQAQWQALSLRSHSTSPVMAGN